jgi:hypothetical protein
MKMELYLINNLKNLSHPVSQGGSTFCSERRTLLVTEYLWFRNL